MRIRSWRLPGAARIHEGRTPLASQHSAAVRMRRPRTTVASAPLRHPRASRYAPSDRGRFDVSLRHMALRTISPGPVFASAPLALTLLVAGAGCGGGGNGPADSGYIDGSQNDA